MKSFLILGGYGNTGKLVAEYLLKETDSKIIIAGRIFEKAKLLADKLNIIYPGNRTFFQCLDARNIEQLKTAYKKVDMVLVCSSTLDYYRNIIDTAIEEGIDYLDINISEEKNQYIMSIKEEIIRKGLCFITDGGFHPGVPAAMVNYASKKFDRIEKANVYGLMKLNWKNYSFSKETVLELVKEFQNYKAFLFKNKEWRKAKTSDFVKIDFEEPFGKQRFYPMNLDEMKELPNKFKPLNETGFYVSGFNWFVDLFVLPFAMITLKIFRKQALNLVGKVFVRGLNCFSKPPFGIILKLQVDGILNNERRKYEMNLINEDGYIMTAVPIVAYLKQYISGIARKTGVWFQANIVEPEQFFEDIKRMGINIEEKFIK